MALKLVGASDVSPRSLMANRTSPFGSRHVQGVFDWFDGCSDSDASESRDLSAREGEVLKLLAEGLAAKQAATHLGISIRTVDNHRQNGMRKLGLRSRAELVLFAVRSGMVAA